MGSPKWLSIVLMAMILAWAASHYLPKFHATDVVDAFFAILGMILVVVMALCILYLIVGPWITWNVS